MSTRIEGVRACLALEPLLEDHVSGFLNAKDALVVERHLGECASCRASTRKAMEGSRLLKDLAEGSVWQVAPALDVEAMRTGAHHLVGHHDFSTFRDSLCQAKSPLKTLDALEVGRAGDEIHITAHARSFLHHQVRNMAGTLKLVGLGRWQPDDVARALAARDRRAGGPTAPAGGLTLVAIRYDRAQ